MRTMFSSFGRALRVGVLVAAMAGMGMFSLAAPRLAGAMNYDDMMPRSLFHEAKRINNAYHDAIDAVNTAEEERMARKKAGASEAELRELDCKIGELVTKAEKLKVKADYLEELARRMQDEYRNK